MIPYREYNIDEIYGDYGLQPDDLAEDRISLPADFYAPPTYDPNENVYDRMDLTEQDLDELRRINEQDYITDEINPEPFLTIDDSIMFAELTIERRLKSNLEIFHDLQKLKTKPVEHYTEEEFQFVRDLVCADNICQLDQLSNS